MKNLTALILAGGEGTRLRPITNTTPKALLEIHGKTMTEHLLDLLNTHGIRDVVLSVGYLKEKIKDYFGDGSRIGMNIRYVEESSPLGTAGPVKKASEQGMLSDTFIVSNGDELKEMDIKEMYEQHRKTNALVTIALTAVENPQDYGVARLDGERIAEFVEKPKIEEAPSNFINAGFYVMQKEILKYVKDGFCMFEREVFPAAAKNKEAYHYKFKGQWFDIGNHARLEKAIKNWKDIL